MRTLAEVLGDLTPDDRGTVEIALRNAAEGLLDEYADGPQKQRICRRLGQRATHCKRGHPIGDHSEEAKKNTYKDQKGGNNCRTCRRAAARRYTERNPKAIRAYYDNQKRRKQDRRLTPTTAFERAQMLREQHRHNQRKLNEIPED